MRPLRFPVFRHLCCALLLLAAIGRSGAQEVDVASVKFTNLRAPGGGPGTWLEADLALNVRPAPGSPGQMVSRVGVTLLLGFELPATAGGEAGRRAPGAEHGEGRRVEYYRADAECVALEAGRTDVRFYLPPEIVKRDQLHGDPKFWAIEVTAGGRPQTPGRTSAAPALAGAEARKTFASHAAGAAPANDGLLQPQYLTPFAAEYPRTTPSFVRREGR